MTDKRLAFTKMQSLGNDFVMLDGIRKHIRLSRNIASRISDRHYGIGCDQIIMAERGRESGEFLMRVFNADGSEVGQCGNGARCFAVFLKDQGLCRDGCVKVETITTRLELEINEDESVSATMGVPEFHPSKIPLLADGEQLQYTVSIDHRDIGFSAVSVGNPHCVLFVPDCATADVAGLGPMLESHPIFPQRANVGFAQAVSRKEINLRVFERGVGETLGCGSGGCAAVASGVRAGILEREVTVNLPGGRAVVDWISEEAPIRLTGGVETVFHGEIRIG